MTDNTQTAPVTAAAAHKALMTARARAAQDAKSPRSTAADWRALEKANAVLAQAREDEEAARAAAFAARVANK